MLCNHNFDIGQVLDYFRLKVRERVSGLASLLKVVQLPRHLPHLQKGDLAIFYELSDGEATESRGIVEVDPSTARQEPRPQAPPTARSLLSLI